MKCVIGNTNMKDFGRAIHSLAKIGEELYIEPSKSKVCFRTINSSRSAYFTYDFGSSFFIHYDSGSGSQSAGEEAIKCKVAMKAVLNVFKVIHSLGRTVERCKFTLKWEDAKLVIQLFCHYGIVKTHNLSFIECEALQAVYDKNACSSHVVSQPRVLLGALSSFHQQTLEEISFCFSPRNVILKTHVEEPDPSKVVHTVVTLMFGEFEDYNITSDCELTVCLKEIKALLTFTDSVNLSTKAYFSSPGSPIIFTFDGKSLYEGTLVLATLVQKSDEQTGESQPASNPSHSKLNHGPKAPSRSKNYDSSHEFAGAGETSQKLSNVSKASENNTANASAVADPIPVFDNQELGSVAQQALLQPQNSSNLNGNISQAEITHPSLSDTRKIMEQEEEMEDSDTVPASPPAKKIKFFFRRCFEATFNPDTLPGHDVILAEDSDEGGS